MPADISSFYVIVIHGISVVCLCLFAYDKNQVYMECSYSFCFFVAAEIIFSFSDFC